MTLAEICLGCGTALFSGSVSYCFICAGRQRQLFGSDNPPGSSSARWPRIQRRRIEKAVEQYKIVTLGAE